MCEIIIRQARAEDWSARAELVRNAAVAHFLESFYLFFFQELTLQAVVLSGAVLFIFFGVSPSGLFLLLPAAAAVVALAVYFTHLSLAAKHAQDIKKEMVGFVAELHGPLFADPQKLFPAIVFEEDGQQSNPIRAVHKQVVGTVSVSEYWGEAYSGWLHALAVHPQWRRRGVARALVSASGAGGARRGLRALRAAVSELQAGAHAALRAAGWSPRGWYRRRVCGAALTLLLSRLGTDLAERRP